MPRNRNSGSSPKNVEAALYFFKEDAMETELYKALLTDVHKQRIRAHEVGIFSSQPLTKSLADEFSEILKVAGFESLTNFMKLTDTEHKILVSNIKLGIKKIDYQSLEEITPDYANSEGLVYMLNHIKKVVGPAMKKIACNDDDNSPSFSM